MEKENNQVSSTAITEQKETSFANGLNFYKLFWIFYIGCFAGVLVETIWCRVTNGFFESRTALVLGPFNPVYGLGAVLITVCFVRFSHKKNITIFLGCAVAGAVFEYFCSLFQELAFGTVSWSYDADSLGILKRTSLVYAVFWGILGIVWVRAIYPNLSKWIEKIPNKVGKPLTWILMAMISFDILYSSAAVYRQEERRHHIPANNVIRQHFDANYPDERLKKIYPHMTPVG